MIDTSALSGWVSPDALDAAAGELKDAGTALQDTTASAKSTWAGLSGIYQAPEQEIVLGAFDDVATAGDDVQEATIKISDALTTFASEVRALIPAKTYLLDQAAIANAAPGETPPSPGPGPSTLQFDISSLAGNYQAAEDRCAASILGVHSSFAGGPGLAGGPLVGISSSIAGGTLNRLNYSPVLQPTFDTPIRTTAPLRMDQLPVDEFYRGTAYTRSASGILLPSHVAATTANPTPVDGRWSNTTLKADPSVAKPPGWAKWGGRGLGVAGAGLTLWDASSSRYRQDLVEHPEWGTGERVASAGIDAVVVGGMSLAGASAGAKAGAVVGGMIGGPAGLVIGIAVGAGLGYLGGALGKEFGEEIREGLGDTADAMAEGIADAGSAIADGAEKVWDSLWG